MLVNLRDYVFEFLYKVFFALGMIFKNWLLIFVESLVVPRSAIRYLSIAFKEHLDC